MTVVAGVGAIRVFSAWPRCCWTSRWGLDDAVPLRCPESVDPGHVPALFCYRHGSEGG